MQLNKISLSFLALIIIAFAYFTTHQKISAKPTNVKMKVGFVDLGKVFKEYDKAKAREKQIRKKHIKEQEKIKAEEEKVKKLREEIQLWKPGSKARKKKEKELAELAFKIKNLKTRAEYFTVLELKNALVKVYNEIDDVIEKYAKKHGYFMILRTEEPDFFEARDPNEVRRKMDSREILYWREKNDITEKIIDILN